MAVQIMKFEDVKKDILNSAYKRCALCDKNGNYLITFNHRNMNINDRLEEIEKRMKSVAMKPGVYQIHAKNFENNSEPGIFYVGVGTQAQQIEDIEIIEPGKTRIELPSLMADGTKVDYETYRELLEENIQLRLQVQTLQIEIRHLEEDIDELECELEEGGGSAMADNNQKFFTNLAETLVPLADKFLEQRDKQLNLTANALALQYGVQQPGVKQPAKQQFKPPVQQQQTMAEEEEEEEEEELTEEQEMQLDALENMRINHPEVYAQMMQKIQEFNNENVEE